jgi:hypothetical protein
MSERQRERECVCVLENFEGRVETGKGHGVEEIFPEIFPLADVCSLCLNSKVGQITMSSC